MRGRPNAPLFEEAEDVVFALFREPFSSDHLFDGGEVRLEDLGRKLGDKPLGERTVLLDEVLGQRSRAPVPRKQPIEGPTGPFFGARPGVLFEQVGVVDRGGEEGGIERVRDDLEEEGTPWDDGFVRLVGGREGMDDAVLVGFEDQAE